MAPCRIHINPYGQETHESNSHSKKYKYISHIDHYYIKQVAGWLFLAGRLSNRFVNPIIVLNIINLPILINTKMIVLVIAIEPFFASQTFDFNP